jgi:intracellular sulfur oxidation DsrE/DsrF family protein
MIPYFKRNGTNARIVAIFHGNSGYELRNDSAYDRGRNLRDGVEIEECGETMASHRWSTAELLPDVQEGFVQLQP